MGQVHDTEDPKFCEIGVESRRQSVRLYIPVRAIGDFHTDLQHATVEIENTHVDALIHALQLARPEK